MHGNTIKKITDLKSKILFEFYLNYLCYCLLSLDNNRRNVLCVNGTSLKKSVSTIVCCLTIFPVNIRTPILFSSRFYNEFFNL